MCSSIKYSYPPQAYGRLTEIPKKAQFLKGISRGGGGFKLKNLVWEGYGYFLEQHMAVSNFLLLSLHFLKLLKTLVKLQCKSSGE